MEQGSCIDINECNGEPSPCDVFADCTNTEGSFACVCQDGFEGDGLLCIIAPGIDMLLYINHIYQIGRRWTSVYTCRRFRKVLCLLHIF